MRRGNEKAEALSKNIFCYWGFLLLIVFMAHALLYFLTPQVPLELSADTSHAETMLTGTINLTPYIKQMIFKGSAYLTRLLYPGFHSVSSVFETDHGSCQTYFGSHRTDGEDGQNCGSVKSMRRMK